MFVAEIQRTISLHFSLMKNFMSKFVSVVFLVLSLSYCGLSIYFEGFGQQFWIAGICSSIATAKVIMAFTKGNFRPL